MFVFSHIPSSYGVYGSITVFAYIILDAFTFMDDVNDNIICHSKAGHEPCRDLSGALM